MLRVGILGIGGISGAHIPTWLSMPNAQVVCVCDIRPEQMKPFDDKPQIKQYTDADTMLEAEQIDVLDICLPTYLHVEYSLKAIRHGIHVLCEKPVSLNSEDVKLLYDAASQHGVKYMVAQVVRFWPEYVLLKELYDTKKYGKLLSGHMSRLGEYPKWSFDNWYTDEKRSGLIPFDLHIHDADFIVYTFGTPQQTTPHRSKRADQDYLCVCYDYGDFFITAEASWFASPYPFKAEFRFQFEEAVVALENGKLMIYERDGAILDLSAAPESEDGAVINLPQTDAYGEEIRYFADCVRNDRPIDKVTPESLKTVIDILRSI